MYKYDKPGSGVPASKVREQFSSVLSKVAVRGDRVLIERHGKAVAAMISIEDFELLQELEDRYDRELAREALAEPGKSIPWDVVKKELGL